jgi:hypothetical protein
MNVIWIFKPRREAMPGWLIYLGSLSVVIGVCVGAWLAH